MVDVCYFVLGFQSDYLGWNLVVYVIYERVVVWLMIVSVSLFVCCDWLNGVGYLNKEFGLLFGIGGELVYGLNVGISGIVSCVIYDVVFEVFLFDLCVDWWLLGCIYVGLCLLWVIGFLLSVSYIYMLNNLLLILY